MARYFASFILCRVSQRTNKILALVRVCFRVACIESIWIETRRCVVCIERFWKNGERSLCPE